MSIATKKWGGGTCRQCRIHDLANIGAAACIAQPHPAFRHYFLGKTIASWKKILPVTKHFTKLFLKSSSNVASGARKCVGCRRSLRSEHFMTTYLWGCKKTVEDSSCFRVGLLSYFWPHFFYEPSKSGGHLMYCPSHSLVKKKKKKDLHVGILDSLNFIWNDVQLQPRLQDWLDFCLAGINVCPICEASLSHHIYQKK